MGETPWNQLFLPAKGSLPLAEALRSVNKYPTTLHGINSAIIKVRRPRRAVVCARPSGQRAIMHPHVSFGRRPARHARRRAAARSASSQWQPRCTEESPEWRFRRRFGKRTSSE